MKALYLQFQFFIKFFIQLRNSQMEEIYRARSWVGVHMAPSKHIDVTNMETP